MCIRDRQFPILPNSLIERLKVKFAFSLWQPTDAAHTAVRFCTSWATKEEHLDELIAEL